MVAVNKKEENKSCKKEKLCKRGKRLCLREENQRESEESCVVG